LGSDVLSAASKLRGHTAASVKVPQPEASSGERWTPPIVKCVATRNEGIAELVAELARHKHWLDSTEAGRARRELRLREQMLAVLRDALAEEAVLALGDAIGQAAADVEARKLDPYTATEALIERFCSRA